MKKKFLTVTFCLMVATQFTQAKQRPNIVLVVADDMEYSSVGAYGCPVKDITPNIDKTRWRN